MSVDNALAALQREENQQIRWLFGDLLVRRAVRQDWCECVILQQLEKGTTRGWNELVRRCGEALADREMVRNRVTALLNPDAQDFDLKLEDFIAEMLCVVWLQVNGYEGIQFLIHGASPTADLRAQRGETCHDIEAKNLREPSSVTFVAFPSLECKSIARAIAIRCTD